jgi:hypothetical protein
MPLPGQIGQERAEYGTWNMEPLPLIPTVSRELGLVPVGLQTDKQMCAH